MSPANLRMLAIDPKLLVRKVRVCEVHIMLRVHLAMTYNMTIL